MTNHLFELINKGIEQPELITLESGFLILPGTDISNLTIKDLRVIVHPFHPQAYVNNPRNPNYEDKRDELIKNCNSPILMGFEEMRLPISTTWLKELNPKGPRVIYKTNYVSHKPNQPPSENFIESVRTLFNPSTVILGGAELYLDNNGSLTGAGCVNGTYRILSPHFEITLSKEYCWQG